jgi:hypothetical protein
VIDSGAVSSTRCPRCSSRRIPGKDRCAKCDWRFEHPKPPAPEEPVGSYARPMIVQVRPDPFERRQVARWLLGAFEVAVPTLIVSALSGWVGTGLAFEVSRAIGNDAFGSALSAIVWGPVFALVGAYVTLRLLAR